MATHKLEDIMKRAERDLYIDPDKLDSAAMVTPMIYHKFLGIFTDIKLVYEKHDLEYKKLYSDKYYYYRNDYHIIPKNASEINLLIEGDEDIGAKLKILVYYRETLEYTEKVMKMIEQRSYLIKNAVDWRKFQSGCF